MTPILEISNVSKAWKGFTLNQINLSLERGYIMGFIGPNGAGKSTTIKLMMNLIRKDSGSIKIFGLDNSKHELDIKNRIGFVLDENHFYEELTLLEMKKIIMPFYRNWDNQAFGRYLKEFDLPGKKKIKDLSKGMKMKFSLAIALSHHAELLVMDEPTSGLDPVARSEFLDILSTIIQDENKGVFFSTHITSDLDKIADYIAFIDQGELILSASKDQLMDYYGVIKASKEFLTPENRKHFIGIHENQFGFDALVEDRKQAIRQFQGKLQIEKPTLEDILIYYTRRNRHA